ncbi:putative ATP-dependent DNA helicase RecQ [Oscillibacter valericigenes Sjm18-20]|nr:putative ATP-dependent DNA helicase RecQ [Oscillibacter valericigenes Sjm18-20]
MPPGVHFKLLWSDSCGHLWKLRKLPPCLCSDGHYSTGPDDSFVQRVKDALGYETGTALILKVLRSSRDQRVLQLGLDQLSTYGLMSRLSQETVRVYIKYLE